MGITVTAKEYVAVVLFIGSNDANIKSVTPQQHVPLEEYKQSMTDIAHYLMVSWIIGTFESY